jgi:hypothetical protein
MLARQRRSGKTRREFGVGHRANPRQSAVTPDDVAAELDVLASRVPRMSPPLAHNSHRFHEEPLRHRQGPGEARPPRMAFGWSFPRTELAVS